MKHYLYLLLLLATFITASGGDEVLYYNAVKKPVGGWQGRLAPGTSLADEAITLIDCDGHTRGPLRHADGWNWSTIPNPCGAKPVVFNVAEMSVLSNNLVLTSNYFASLDAQNKIITISTAVDHAARQDANSSATSSLNKVFGSESVTRAFTKQNVIVTYRLQKGTPVKADLSAWNDREAVLPTSGTVNLNSALQKVLDGKAVTRD